MLITLKKYRGKFVIERIPEIEEAAHYTEEENQDKQKVALSTVAITVNSAAEQQNVKCQEEAEEVHILS